VIAGGLVFWNIPREKETSPVSFRARVKEAPTVARPAAPEEPALRAASPLEAIERLAMYEKVETLEKMFAAADGLGASEKAALIDAAVSLDDPQLIARAETLALEMINEGSEADVLSVLPMIPQFPEDSRLRSIPQESLCRFSGFGLEIVKLKYDRTFPHGRPWASVCRES
jgi:hypothetical protein